MVLESTQARIYCGDGLQDVGILIELQIQGMGNPRVRMHLRLGEIQFVVIGDGLAFSNQEYRVLVVCLRLQAADVAIVIGGREQFHWQTLAALQRLDIQLAHLLPKHHSLTGS